MTPLEIQEWREALWLDQEAAGCVLDISKWTFRKYESGRLPIPRTVEYACKWVLWYGVDRCTRDLPGTVDAQYAERRALRKAPQAVFIEQDHDEIGPRYWYLIEGVEYALVEGCRLLTVNAGGELKPLTAGMRRDALVEAVRTAHATNREEREKRLMAQMLDGT